jgi:hypothetical protein
VLTVQIPPSLPSGAYVLKVSAAAGEGVRSTTVSIAVDGNVPVMPMPRLRPVVGARFETTSFQARLAWDAATDADDQVAGYEAQLQRDGAAVAAVTRLGPTARYTPRTVAVASVSTLRVRAVDRAGNWSAWAEVHPVSSVVVQDSNRSLVRAGRWSQWASRYQSGGTTRYATARGASTSLRFTGRGVAVVMALGPGRGKAQIWVDGILAGTVDTWRSRLASRVVVYSTAWASPAVHTVKVRVLGTVGRPRVDLDAFLVIH